jgi:hypothetical protein
MPRFTLDAIKKRAEEAGNLIDNVKYSGKISANPMETNIVRDIARDEKRSTERTTAVQEGNADKKDMSPIEKDFVKNHPALGEFYKAGKQFVMRDLP